MHIIIIRRNTPVRMINHVIRERSRARVNYVCTRPPAHTYNKYFSFSFFFPVLISKHPPELRFSSNQKKNPLKISSAAAAAAATVTWKHVNLLPRIHIYLYRLLQISTVYQSDDGGFRVFSRRRHDDNIIAVFLFIIRPEQDYTYYIALTKKKKKN